MKNIMEDKDLTEYRESYIEDKMENLFGEIYRNMGNITELTPNEINDAKSLAVEHVLLADILNHDYTRIQKMIENAHINNEQLVSMIDKQRPINVNFKEEVFFDMSSLLNEKIMSDHALGEMFITIYSEKYKDAYQIAEKIIKNGNKQMKRKLDSLSLGEADFCYYLLLDSEYVSNLDKELLCFLKANVIFKNFVSLSDYEENIRRIKEITFSETEDSVLCSKQFEKFLFNRKSEMAEFLEVKECEISKAISMDMDFSEIHLDKYYPSKIAKLISRFVVMENKGAGYWLGDIAGSESTMSYYYRPDVDRIIKTYYMVQVVLMHERFIRNTGRFTKLDLSRGWDINPERDVQGICYMYCLDVFYKMFSEMMKEYYKIFPWTNTAFENMQAQYEQMENDLNKIIDEQKNEIDLLNRKISLHKVQDKKSISNDIDKVIAKYERQTGKLNKEIEQKDKEILELKSYIKSQEEFIALQNSTEPEKVDIVDEEYLRSKKYLFVGNAKEALPELKSKFPNSIFMQTETANISKISVDMIVFLKKWMSHGMYYKVKNSKIYQKVPSVMCNSKNINRIYYDMDRQLAVN